MKANQTLEEEKVFYLRCSRRCGLIFYTSNESNSYFRFLNRMDVLRQSEEHECIGVISPT